MNSDRLNTALRHRSSHYAFAAGAVALGAVLRYGTDVWVGPLPTYITFYPAVMLAALLGGFGPGLMATVLVGVMSDWWLLLPSGFGINDIRDAVGLGLFSFMGVLMSAVATLYRRARVKAAAYDQTMAVRESDKRFRSLAEEMPHFVWETDAIGTPLYANQRFLDYSCLSFDQVQDGGWLRVQHPDDAPRVAAAWNSAIKNNAEYDLETRFREAGSGEYRWFRIKGSPIYDESGQLIRWVGTCTDIHEVKLAQEALQESQEDLNRAQAVAHTGSWRLNIQRNELLWSEENYRIFGVPEGTTLSYETFLSIVHPEDREYVHEKWSAALRGEPYDIEHRIIADGAVKWVRERATLEFDSSGALLGGFGTTQDITELKHLERALQNRMQELQTIFDSVPAMVFYKDRENRFIRVNKELESAMGKAKHELEGKSLFDLYPAEQAEEYWRDDNEVLASGQPKLGISEVMTTPAGPRLVQTDKVPYIDEAGKVSGVIGFALDITERKRSEKALRESEENFRSLANAMPQLAWTAMADGHIFWYNQRWYDFTGTTFEQMDGWGWQSVHDPVALPRVLEKWHAALAAGQIFEMEFPLRGADGHFRQFLTRSVPLKDEAGRIVRWFGTNTDITELKQAEETLRRSKDELAQLVQERTAMLNKVNELLRVEILRTAKSR